MTTFQIICFAVAIYFAGFAADVAYSILAFAPKERP